MAKSNNADHLHKLSIGVMAKGLGNLAKIMDKAESHAASHDIGLESYLQARLFPDMFNLLQQVQYACFLSADFARHFSANPAPRVGYDETTWPELRNSLAVAGDYLRAITPEAVLKNADVIVPTFMDDTRGMTTVDYAADVIVPDFNFHLVIAYALLRHNGVSLGKNDFLGDFKTVTFGAGASD